LGAGSSQASDYNGIYIAAEIRIPSLDQKSGGNLSIRIVHELVKDSEHIRIDRHRPDVVQSQTSCRSRI